MGWVGQAILTCSPKCYKNGNWSHDQACFLALFIAATACGLLPSIANGEIQYPSNSTGIGSVARYKCFPGYSLQGDAERICQEDSQWSGTQPVCQGTNACAKDISDYMFEYYSK